MMTNITFK